MEKQLLVHKSISDLYRSLGNPIEQEIDFTIHYLPEMHQVLPFKSPVFRADYFSFVFIKNGSGKYTLDDKVYDFSDRTIYFTNPGHVKSFDIQRSEDAYIVTLTESFLRENVHPNIFEEFPFLLAETVPPKALEKVEFEAFERLYLQLKTEFESDSSSYKNRILGNLFVVILLKIKSLFWEDYDPIAEGDRSSEIVRKFKTALEHETLKANTDAGIGHQMQVQEYAQEMNLHPNYLNSVIKSKTGKTVNEWISEKTIAVSKSLLLNTSLSAKEIAFRLGFSEATHFNRFFKKRVGSSPISYRKNA